MKLNKLFLGTLAVVLTACSPSFLDVEPNGSTVTQEQYDNNPKSLDAHLLGLYRLMDIGMTDSHDSYGQKSNDIYSDVLSGDAAIKNPYLLYDYYAEVWRLNNSTAQFNNYEVWAFYYKIIKNANVVIRNAKKLKIKNTDDEKAQRHYLGQALAMRAYSYFNLAVFYGKANDQLGTGNGLDDDCCPVYNEEVPDTLPVQLSSLREVYNFIQTDLDTAIVYLQDYQRTTKTNIDLDVAKLLLASAMLQRGVYDDNATIFTKARDLAIDVINGGKFSMLGLDEVTTNGFNNINTPSWMWGKDITAETTGMLKSFWGRIDIFTYSYAFGPYCVQVDARLYEDNKIIYPNDVRFYWWDVTYKGQLSQKDQDNYKYAPLWKFYTPARDLDNLDRAWLNDILYMRIEEAYLVAAEAAYRLKDFTNASKYLQELLENRDPVTAATITTITNASDFEHLLQFNWRVEMWGEGRGLRTLKRFGNNCDRGSNHYNTQKTSVPTSVYFTFSLPNSEYVLNPYAH